MALISAVLMAVIVFVLQWKYFQSHWERGLTVELKFCQRGVNAGEGCQLREVICNAKRMPLPALQVKFQTAASFRFAEEKNAVVSDYYYRTDAFAVAGQKRVTRTLNFVPAQRGFYQLDTLDILVKDYFMTSQYSSRRANETSLYVYPHKRDTSAFELLYRQMLGEMIARKRMEEDLFAFRGIREYRPTDSMRRINWKSSAQNGRLLVNMYESSFSQQVCILLDGHTRSVLEERYMQECGISIASSVAGRLLQMGIPVSLQSDARDILTGELVCTEAGSNRHHLLAIDRSLARIDLSAELSSFVELVRDAISDNGSRICYLLITSAYSKELEREMQRQRENGIELYGIFPCHREEEEWELPDGMVYWEV